jgi:hypothetical protein
MAAGSMISAMALAGLFALGGVACGGGVDQETEDAVRDAGEAVRRAGEQVESEVQEAGEAAERAGERAQTELEEVKSEIDPGQ